MLRKKRKGYEKKQVEKEGVSHELGGFSTRFVFLFCVIYSTLELSEVVFFQLLSGTRNTVSLVNITPNKYTFLESLESWLVLKPQKWPVTVSRP